MSKITSEGRVGEGSSSAKGEGGGEGGGVRMTPSSFKEATEGVIKGDREGGGIRGRRGSGRVTTGPSGRTAEGSPVTTDTGTNDGSESTVIGLPEGTKRCSGKESTLELVAFGLEGF